MPGNWGRLCPFDVIFSANDSVFRAEHDPLPRIAYFLTKTRVLRVRKRCSTLKMHARYIYLPIAKEIVLTKHARNFSALEKWLSVASMCI